MTTFTDTVNLQGLFEDTKQMTGQTNMSIALFTRKANFALNDYSSIAMSVDGGVRFDSTNHADDPLEYAAIVAGQRKYLLETTMLQIDRVEVYYEDKWHVVDPLVMKDYKHMSLETVFSENGRPTHYDWDGNTMSLYPAPDATDTGDLTATANLSLKVFNTRAAKQFTVTDTDVSIGIPSVHNEYISLKAAQKIMFGTNDPSVSNIDRELIKWEGQMVSGRMSGGKIRQYFTIRDENRPRRIKPKLNGVFSNLNFSK